ncbi:MAG TPA: primosomal protein N' [Gemmatimonadaceae bacterium]
MYVSVAVPIPSLGLLTYRVPDEWGTPVPGARVLVPVGARTVTGIVVDRAEAPHESVSVKPLADVLDGVPFLPPDVVRLARWVAEYYVSSPGEALAAAMPPRAEVETERRVRLTSSGEAALEAGHPDRGVRGRLLRLLAGGKPEPIARLARKLADGSARAARGTHAVVNALAADGLVEIELPLVGKSDAFRTEKVAAITAQGLDAGAMERLGPRQLEAIAALRGAPEGLSFATLADRGVAPDTVQRLAARGLVAIHTRRVERDPFTSGAFAMSAVDTSGLSLTGEQAAAIARLERRLAAKSFHAAVLHGVTGSGKTEVYLRLARLTLAQGRRVLMLVPEIALTPSVAARFRTAFGDRVAIQHSGLSDGERHDQWHRIRDGAIDVAVGTRSAVFAPLRDIGLIVVDEEHDGSYKQDDTPRYNGRDVAVVRAREAGALVVLGSATPSLETYFNAVNGRYEAIVLDRRVLDRPLADVQVVDMRDEMASEGPDVVLSRALVQALQETHAKGEQAVVLLNRRGYAAAVFCRQCGNTAECPNCSVSLTVHLQSRRARCHYCNYSITVPRQCPKCAAPYLDHIGYGTERVESEVAKAVPGARVARLDRDTARRRGAITALLSRFAAGELDVLVGTQMIAKGHDFPRVTLVGVVSADVGLGLADFRAAERTFQLLTQVAGRAGRGESPGIAIVQTLFPGHYSIRHACRQDYRAFFQDELKYRQAMHYPPTMALINTIVRGATLLDAMTTATDLARRVRTGPYDLRVLGPAIAPLSRLRGEHRVQFFIKGRNRRVMRQALVGALEQVPDARRKVVIDVDPLTVL